MITAIAITAVVVGYSLVAGAAHKATTTYTATLGWCREDQTVFSIGAAILWPLIAPAILACVGSKIATKLISRRQQSRLPKATAKEVKR